MPKRAKQFAEDQSGAMAVAMALFLVVLLAVAALAIDYGHMAWVQNELQKAADAGAVAGARFLAPYVGTPASPNWVSAQNQARQTVRLNRADGQFLTDCEAVYGYWSLSNKTLQPPGIVPTISDLPAIRVKIVKKGKQNGGPLRLLFAPIFGMTTQNLSAQATAVISGPYNIPPHGGAFPMAVPKVVVEQYWNQEPPVSIKIGSTYHDPEGGQWTSWFADANDVPTIRDLIASGNPSSLKIGDMIWIEPGTMTTLYDDAAILVGQTVLLTVVDVDFSCHAYTPILGFASFYIEDAAGGDDKYIQGHFVKNIIDQATAGGPIFGTFVPTAKLVY
jgi:Flp pilus assembly protein TadG